MDTTPSYSIYICPHSHQNLMGEQPTWKLTLRHAYKMSSSCSSLFIIINLIYVIVKFATTTVLEFQHSDTQSNGFHAKPSFMFILLAAIAMATQVSCHYVYCKNVDDVLHKLTFEMNNKSGEVVKGTYTYPSDVAVVAFNNVIMGILEGACEHLGIVGEHNPRIIQVILVVY